MPETVGTTGNTKAIRIHDALRDRNPAKAQGAPSNTRPDTCVRTQEIPEPLMPLHAAGSGIRGRSAPSGASRSLSVSGGSGFDG